MAFIRKVHEIEHHDFGCSCIFADECRDTDPWEWTTQDLITFEEATKVYMVKVIVNPHC